MGKLLGGRKKSIPADAWAFSKFALSQGARKWGVKGKRTQGVKRGGWTRYRKGRILSLGKKNRDQKWGTLWGERRNQLGNYESEQSGAYNLGTFTKGGG